MSKNILITGFTSDIGIALVNFMNEKHDIHFHLVARDSSKINKFVNNNCDKNISTYEIDVTDENNVRDLFAKLKQDKVKLDSVITLVGQHLIKPLRFSRKNDYLDLFNSNFISVSNIVTSARSVINQGGSIVLVGSAAISRGSDLVSAYVASKSALCGYVRSAALEFADLSVRVNCIHPGVVITKASEIFMNNISDEARANMIKRHPLGLGSPIYIASVIDFLTSNDSKWITGQSINVDGGFSISS
jgi:NAD(P)-dependent dehydrogenase (short-subunit alcohol dehydrogenase family)